MSCELCESAGGESLWSDRQVRVVRVGDADYPAFCRVIWQAHVTEMTDLDGAERRHFMDVVFALESALRELLQPDKINLASLGNMTPHLHWHVIPRFAGDRHFPHPIWGSPQREGRPLPLDMAALAAALERCLAPFVAESDPALSL
jgi:diadenosine tetraphosphate (Ap4A) HIT family hydrolase